MAIYNIMEAQKNASPYGRYTPPSFSGILIPAKIAWFVQELPSFLVPVLLLYRSGSLETLGCKLLLFMFCGHYFHRTFIYAVLNRGHPTPISTAVFATIFCTFNGYLQGYSMIYCTEYDNSWTSDWRFISGIVLFVLGMGINIHSDYIIRNLRNPGDVVYNIPKGGLFEYISGANFFGEILEWSGYAIATWSFPAFSFAVFSASFVGPRAYHHHRYYLEKFDDYPKSRKAVIPFIF
ncbi:3-oxo-5-alpha-steroid 4-dehydrogenase 2-like [Callorhinchus milii]|uniref:3-oxo-5-alpha-steroid 4-dehydrogenase 2-like n=1 Tax=Callorhinchus milii TaxID=7868 RepID=UPI001C3F89D3|nr:3-oxo-5-alpha-steroid 4-dehydrogenase 2-like [Callorhinchus milii]